MTGRDGKALKKEELQRYVCAYLSVESENPKNTVYFDRSKNKNGIFETIDTSEQKSVLQIIDQLVRCSQFEASLHRFFVDITNRLETGSFVDDYSTIALEAPELQENFIHQAFVHVGEHVSQKNIVSGLTRVLEMEKILYHAIAWSDDRNSIYILSKQCASQV